LDIASWWLSTLLVTSHTSGTSFLLFLVVHGLVPEVREEVTATAGPIVRKEETIGCWTSRKSTVYHQEPAVREENKGKKCPGWFLTNVYFSSV